MKIPFVSFLSNFSSLSLSHSNDENYSESTARLRHPQPPRFGLRRMRFRPREAVLKLRSACFAITLWSSRQVSNSLLVSQRLEKHLRVLSYIQKAPGSKNDFFKSRKAAEHAAANVALLSLPFDGFQEDDWLSQEPRARSFSRR